jgi:hypothetical protein
MSLGTNSKCDLSADLAKIDLNILTKQTENHYYSLLRQLKQKTEEVLNDSLSFTNRKDALLSMSATGADTVQRLSEAIAETTELLHTLYNTKDRRIEIVR